MRTRREIPGQLPMLMTGNEIKDFVHASVDLPSLVNRLHGDPETLEHKATRWQSFWGRKRSENQDQPDFVNSVATEGVHTPITISPGTHTYRDERDERQTQGIWVHGEGHHRTQASADIEEQTGRKVYVPVVFDEDPLYQRGQPRQPGAEFRRL